GVRVLELRLAVAQALYLAADERDAALHLGGDEVVVGRPAVEDPRPRVAGALALGHTPMIRTVRAARKQPGRTPRRLTGVPPLLRLSLAFRRGRGGIGRRARFRF